MEGCRCIFLVDSGASVSTIGCLAGKPPPLSHRSLKTMGFSGKPMEQSFTTPLNFDILEQRGSHSFLYAPACPINLLGRDITLACDLGGITLYHPLNPAPQDAHMCMLVDDPRPETHEDTTIYWQELSGAAQTIPGLADPYGSWKFGFSKWGITMTY